MSSKGEKGDQGVSGVQGVQGRQGVQGIPGKASRKGFYGYLFLLVGMVLGLYTTGRTLIQLRHEIHNRCEATEVQKSILHRASKSSLRQTKELLKENPNGIDHLITRAQLISSIHQDKIFIVQTMRIPCPKA